MNEENERLLDSYVSSRLSYILVGQMKKISYEILGIQKWYLLLSVQLKHESASVPPEDYNKYDSKLEEYKDYESVKQTIDKITGEMNEIISEATPPLKVNFLIKTWIELMLENRLELGYNNIIKLIKKESLRIVKKHHLLLQVEFYIKQIQQKKTDLYLSVYEVKTLHDFISVIVDKESQNIIIEFKLSTESENSIPRTNVIKMMYFFLTNIRYIIKRKYRKINKIVLSIQLDDIKKIGSITYLLVETLKLIQYNNIIYNINTIPSMPSDFVINELFYQFSLLPYKLDILNIKYSSGIGKNITIDKVLVDTTIRTNELIIHQGKTGDNAETESLFFNRIIEKSVANILTIKYDLRDRRFRYPIISNDNILMLKIMHYIKFTTSLIIYTENIDDSDNDLIRLYDFIDKTKTKSLDLSKSYFPYINLLTALITYHDYKMVKLPSHILISKNREYEVDDYMRYCYEIERLVFILLSKTINEPVISKESLISCYKTFYENFEIYNSIINTNVREISFKDNDVIISDSPRPLQFIWFSNHLWYDVLSKLIAKINNLKTNSDSVIENFLVYFDNEYVTMINMIFARHF